MEKNSGGKEKIDGFIFDGDTENEGFELFRQRCRRGERGVEEPRKKIKGERAE